MSVESGETSVEPSHSVKDSHARKPFIHRITFANPEFFLSYKGTSVLYPWYKSLPQVESFEARNDDLCLISFPRSGKNWLSAVVWMIKNAQSSDSLHLETSLNEVVPFLEQVLPLAIDNPSLRDIERIKAAQSPRLYATHLGADAIPDSVLEKAKIICLLRNPKDVVVSLYNFYRGLRAIDFQENLSYVVDQFMDPQGKIFFGPYFDHIASYWRMRDKPNILVLTYEDLVKGFIPTVKRISDFMGMDLTQEQLINIQRQSSFDQMKANPATNRQEMETVHNVFDRELSNYMKAGKVGSWKDQLSKTDYERLDLWISHNLQRLELHGLQFQFD